MILSSADGSSLAEIGKSVARDVYKINLDYEVASLNDLDLLIERISQSGDNASGVQNMLFIFGCYLGEVLLRNIGGEWLATVGSLMEGNTPYPLVVRIKESGAICNPIGKVFKRFENGADDSLPAFYEAVSAYRPD